ncbi:MAG TPA: sugar phosphate isomerase/epimerase family protein [Candidatus Limnocylindria bacterium]|jgi:sugar phosphate isomerase/epimerase|nr:sugar phosphate isomerase/epimerase family protein [Candidatus Limnocylindria bacterium]
MMTTPEADKMAMCWHGDPGHIMRRVAEIGYEGVELQVRDPEQLDAAALGKLAKDAGIAVTAISTGSIGSSDGLYFCAGDADVRRRTIERYKSVLRFASAFGVDASIGRMRGTTKMAPDAKTAWGWFRAALEELLPLAESLGVRIVLEPQARYIGDMLNTIGETVDFIKTFDTKSLTFEADLHHQGYEERSLVGALVAAQRSGYMTYVQIADSNRLAPGSGSFNWVDIIETLRALGYDGWLAMEFQQTPDYETCAQQAYRVVKGALDGYRP